MWYISAVQSEEEEASNCSTYLILKNDILWDTTFSLHFFVCHFKMNCILSLVTKNVLSLGCYCFHVIVMTTTNSNHSVPPLFFHYMNWYCCMYVYMKRKEIGLTYVFCFHVNNDCEITIKNFVYFKLCICESFPNRVTSVCLETVGSSLSWRVGQTCSSICYAVSGRNNQCQSVKWKVQPRQSFLHDCW